MSVPDTAKEFTMETRNNEVRYKQENEAIGAEIECLSSSPYQYIKIPKADLLFKHNDPYQAADLRFDIPITVRQENIAAQIRS